MWRRRITENPTPSDGDGSEQRLLAETAAKLRSELDELCARHAKDTERLLLGVVEAVDAMDRVFASIRERDGELKEQMKLWVGNFRTVRRLLLRSLGDQQVFLLESGNESFDPEKHHAFDTKVDATHAEGTILEEIQPGYVWGDRVLRKAQVVVSLHPADACGKADDQKADNQQELVDSRDPADESEGAKAEDANNAAAPGEQTQ